MIYKNEDGSIYKIKLDRPMCIPSSDPASDSIFTVREVFSEIEEILNHLIKEVKGLKEDAKMEKLNPLK